MKRLFLEGPFLTQSGYGEHARYVLRSLRHRRDIDLYANPLDWGVTSWLSQDDEECPSHILHQKIQMIRLFPHSFELDTVYLKLT